MTTRMPSIKIFDLSREENGRGVMMVLSDENVAIVFDPKTSKLVVHDPERKLAAVTVVGGARPAAPRPAERAVFSSPQARLAMHGGTPPPQDR